MSVLDLNLASRPFRNNVPLWAGYGLASALLAGLTWWNLHAYLEASRETASLRASLSTLDGRMESLEQRWEKANKEISRIDVKSLQARAAKANEFIERRTLSWTRLFNLLEQVVPPEVRMTSIRPVSAFGEPSERREPAAEGKVPVTLEGIAQNLEAFLELERALILDTHFERVEPEKNDFMPGGEMRFGLKFLYDPEGRKDLDHDLTLPHPLAAAAAADGEAVEGETPAASPAPSPSPSPAPPRPGTPSPPAPRKRGRR